MHRIPSLSARTSLARLRKPSAIWRSVRGASRRLRSLRLTPPLHTSEARSAGCVADAPSDHGPFLDPRQECAERRRGTCKRRKRCALAPTREQGWPETGARLFHQTSVARKRLHAAQTMSDPRVYRCLLPVIAPVRRAGRAPQGKRPCHQRARDGAARRRAGGREDGWTRQAPPGRMRTRREVFRPSAPRRLRRMHGAGISRTSRTGRERSDDTPRRRARANRGGERPRSRATLRGKRRSAKGPHPKAIS